MAESASNYERNQRLERILADYLHALEAGQTPDRAELFKQHPDLAADLNSFLRNRDAMERIAEPIKAQLPPLAETIGASESLVAGELAVIRYFGDYELLEEIARGGMGVVYRAKQRSLNRIVAVKMILAGQLASEADVQRFKTEAEAAGNLDHPNIVPIYEVGEHEGQHYFSMKLVDGESLAQAARARGSSKKGQRWVAGLAAKVARAVHHANQRGILHRDLKPGNILLDAQGEPHVTDFGLAKRVEGASTLTQSGVMVGTPSYMAPEQVRAEKQLTTAVDVYGLGAVLYELLARCPPFAAKTPFDTMMQVLEGEPAAPRTVRPEIDRDLETICLKCLHKQPPQRYESAAALADDLDRWLRNEPIKARSAGPWERLRKYVRRKPAAASLIAVCSLALAALLAILSVSVMWISKSLRAEELTSYLQRIGRAQSEWQAGNLDRADSLLAECPPELRSWEWNYLYHLCHAEQRVFRGHAERVYWPITAITFSADGRRAASLDRGGGVRIWDPDSCQTISSLQLDGARMVAGQPSPRRGGHGRNDIRRPRRQSPYALRQGV